MDVTDVRADKSTTLLVDESIYIYLPKNQNIFHKVEILCGNIAVANIYYGKYMLYM